MFVQSLIDLEKWNKAVWRATLFMTDFQPDSPPPVLGIAFENAEVGKQIFRGWLDRLGRVDRYEELRVSIVEGDIPHEKPGYTVHINSNPLNTIERAREMGQVIDSQHIVTVGRFHRMNPASDSPHLGNFKKAYQQHGKYLLVPASMVGTMGATPYLDYAIGKTQILFRHVSEIGADDIDMVVFGKDKDLDS